MSGDLRALAEAALAIHSPRATSWYAETHHASGHVSEDERCTDACFVDGTICNGCGTQKCSALLHPCAHLKDLTVIVLGLWACCEGAPLFLLSEAVQNDAVEPGALSHRLEQSREICPTTREPGIPLTLGLPSLSRLT